MLRRAWLVAEGKQMNCDEAKVLLHGLLDDEIDAEYARRAVGGDISE
jgi:hypothetical protein